MKLAISYWNGRVSPLFDTADTVMVFEIKNNREKHRFKIHLNREDPLIKTGDLSRSRIDVVICGAISRELKTLLTAAGIRVISNICGQAENVLQAYLAKKLQNRIFCLPGCCRQHRKRSGYGQQNRL